MYIYAYIYIYIYIYLDWFFTLANTLFYMKHFMKILRTYWEHIKNEMRLKLNEVWYIVSKLSCLMLMKWHEWLVVSPKIFFKSGQILIKLRFWNRNIRFSKLWSYYQIYNIIRAWNKILFVTSWTGIMAS